MAFLIEGGLFIGGVGFVNGQTLLPGIILEEGGPAWLAALAPSLMMVGIFGAPVFTASRVDRLQRLKPFVIWTGAGMRLMYLVAGLLFLLAGLGLGSAIWILALTPLLAGFAGGLGLTAWQRLFLAAVPSASRPSNIAGRFLIGGALGILAGRVIELCLAHLPLLEAFAVLHLAAFVVLTLSLLMQVWIVEPSPDATETVASDETLEGTAGLRAAARRLVSPGPERGSRLAFMATVVLMHGFFLTTPFFAAYLVDVLDQTKSFLGRLAMAQMAGMATGNLLAAWMGHRWGGRFTLALGCLLLGAVLLAVPLVDRLAAGLAIYFVNATAIMMMIVGKDALILDFAPRRSQGSFFTLIALITMTASLSCSMSGYALHRWFEDFRIMAAAGAAFCLLCFIAVSYVREPRSDVRADPLGALYRGVLRYFR